MYMLCLKHVEIELKHHLSVTPNLPRMRIKDGAIVEDSVIMGSHIYQVWSLVRRFNQPQKYKPFTNRCVVHGKLEKGSLREVGVKSGLPATASTKRLELLDDKEHILSIRIIGRDHRLKIGVGLMVFHQLGGISELTSYASSIFVSTGCRRNIWCKLYRESRTEAPPTGFGIRNDFRQFTCSTIILLQVLKKTQPNQ